ncbi:hypothetical protein [Burkholderia stagnalis]|uniref:Uncharacterized protein n=1 Tax=Burkholderia stagnalis TaxID=1503054 RepID=A0A6L3N4Y9_9BURK|nr:hypothetical protein [Burkholderia stagnalis]KAB0641242.1 hypothetical protein F7R25_01630 [Burkholderia stagnalis]MDY7801764.1 hypothetical protein [Burkholderia stagnalis]
MSRDIEPSLPFPDNGVQAFAGSTRFSSRTGRRVLPASAAVRHRPLPGNTDTGIATTSQTTVFNGFFRALPAPERDLRGIIDRIRKP